MNDLELRDHLVVDYEDLGKQVVANTQMQFHYAFKRAARLKRRARRQKSVRVEWGLDEWLLRKVPHPEALLEAVDRAVISAVRQALDQV